MNLGVWYIIIIYVPSPFSELCIHQTRAATGLGWKPWLQPTERGRKAHVSMKKLWFVHCCFNPFSQYTGRSGVARCHRSGRQDKYEASWDDLQGRNQPDKWCPFFCKFPLYFFPFFYSNFTSSGIYEKQREDIPLLFNRLLLLDIRLTWDWTDISVKHHVDLRVVATVSRLRKSRSSVSYFAKLWLVHSFTNSWKKLSWAQHQTYMNCWTYLGFGQRFRGVRPG